MKIKLADKEYQINELNDSAEALIRNLKNLSELEKEKKADLNCLKAVHQELFKNLKKEIIAAKAGLVF